MRRFDLFDNVLAKVWNVGDNSILKKGSPSSGRLALTKSKWSEKSFIPDLFALSSTLCSLGLVPQEFSVSSKVRSYQC